MRALIIGLLLLVAGLSIAEAQQKSQQIPVWTSQLKQARTPYLDSDNFVLCIKPGGCGPNDSLNLTNRGDLFDLMNYIDQKLANLPGGTIISCIGVGGGILVQGACPGGGGGGGGGNVRANANLASHVPVVGDDGTNTVKTIAAGGTNDQVFFGLSGADPLFRTVTGDTTFAAGASTTHSVNGNTQVAFLNIQDQLVTGGANVTSQTQTTGNITIDCGKRPAQYIANTGAFIITAPAADGYCILDVENGAGAGAVTPFGFSPNTIGGDTLDTVNGHNFRLFISRNHSRSTIFARALQ